MRRALRVLAPAALVLAGLAGCTDDGDPDAFCDRIGSVPDLGAILSSIDASDPGSIEGSISDGLAQFRALEADAPGDVRADLARLRQGMELILAAVQDNPDDPAGAREDILAQSEELSGLAEAGDEVATYARTECGVDLGAETSDEGGG